MQARNDTLVWDLPTRLFHWTLVLLIALQFASGEFGWLSMQWHFCLGYSTLALVLFRLLWGLFGSQSSRFTDFVRGPRATLRYAMALLRAPGTHAPGHNPLGAWSVLAMLASVALQAVSGLFTSDDIMQEGPLVEHVSNATVDLFGRIHYYNRYVLVALIAMHVAAVVLHGVLRKHRLLPAMLHGHAEAPLTQPLRFASAWRAMILLVISVALVTGMVLWAEAA
ncbi:cytochrome b/b6 domain-containing protein [Dokdonella sp.]|uniref:cytochrome b/b6 domain-containing protein n=1 Tax=Dokdonella sp. TaxID=2291710 RepID=UPI0031C95A87|nr:cytochrome b/b6 domain-containing protein [Dokdonella sp.]